MSTTSRTVSSPGMRSARAADASPTRGRSSNTSTRPSRSPRTSAVPAVGCMRADAICRSVVLPAPLRPSTTHRSPSFTCQSTASRMVLGWRRTVTPFRSRTALMVTDPIGWPSWSHTRPGSARRPASRPGPRLRVERGCPPRSALLALWLRAARLGDDDGTARLVRAVERDDEPHVVSGALGDVRLADLAGAWAGDAREVVALAPVPGDVSGVRPRPPRTRRTRASASWSRRRPGRGRSSPRSRSSAASSSRATSSRGT